MPSVRIVMPTYNRAETISEAVESVRGQSYSDWELVVVDDGSTDSTEAVLTKLAADESRLRVIPQPNSGAASARNTGIKARGEFEYLAFLDSDDLWKSHHLETSLEALNACGEVGFVFSKMVTHDLSGKWTPETLSRREARLRRSIELSEKEIGEGAYLIRSETALSALIHAEIAPLTSTVVIRHRDLCGLQFADDLLVMEDILLWISLAARGLNFAYLDGEHVVARYHGDNLTANLSFCDPRHLARLKSVLEFNRRKRRYCKTRRDRRCVNQTIASSAYLVGQSCAEQRMVISAVQSYLTGLWHHPNLLTLRGIAAALFH